jgi:CubicO group peptidase (beta-lactamase class C family)
MKVKLSLILLILFSLSGTTQSLYFPPSNNDNWETTSPESLGWCTENLDSLYYFLESNNSKAFIVLKDGKIVLEKYFDNFTQDSFWYWASAGKSLTAFLIGMAQEDGFLKISDTTSKYLSDGWTSCSQSDEHKITILNQLTMTTGLDDGLANPDCTDQICLKCLADPGTRWAYHNAPYTLLDDVLEAATGKTRNLYLTQKFNGTGISGMFFPIGYNRLFISTPRVMARFGLLMLNEGVWDQKTIMSDTSYFNHMINTSQALNKSYGYLWWLNGKTSYMIPQLQYVFQGMISPDAPADMYSALGKNGQILNIVPSENLIMVRMGDAPGTGNGLIAPLFNNEIWKYFNQVYCTSSVEEKESFKTGIKVFPNPATHELNIESREKILKVEISDSHGRLLKVSKTNSKNLILNISDIKEGFCIVKIFYRNEIEIVKFLKI